MPPLLKIESLSEATFLPYGWVLGQEMTAASDGPFFTSRNFRMWRTHLLDTGGSDKIDVLWMNLASRENRVDQLQTRFITEEALIPLSGPLIQVVAISRDDGKPNMESVRAFVVPVGLGICMRPHCWYATHALRDDITVIVLSRRSSTYDFLVHLQTGAPACETGVISIDPRRLVS
jgi:ureidoglycolate lyase